mmetsp:Transcript_122762/g.223109  ORF Transcript_122762/g.223109 Transcript_122762/m.223109 type:complete len:584 (-) Transcript_122762:75-1826(-)
MEQQSDHVVNIEHALNGEHITSMTLPATATVWQVKQYIQGAVNASAYCLKLCVSHGNGDPVDDDSSLADLANPLTLALLKVPHSVSMKLIVTYQLRQRVEYTADENMTAADLKSTLAKRFHTPKVLQSLVVGSMVLGDHVVLSSLGQASRRNAPQEPLDITMQVSWDALPKKTAGKDEMLAALHDLPEFPTSDAAIAAVRILETGSHFKDVRFQGLLVLSQMQLWLADNRRAVPLLQDLVKAGYSLSEVFSCRFSQAQMKQAGYSLRQLRQHGCSASELRQGGFTAKQIFEAGLCPNDLREAFSASELHAAGYSLVQLREQGFSVGQLQECGFAAREMVQAGFGATELLEAFNAGELRSGGHAFAFDELQASGYAPVSVQVKSMCSDTLLGPEPWPEHTTISDLCLATLARNTSLVNKHLELVYNDEVLKDDMALRQLEAKSVHLRAVVTSGELTATFAYPGTAITVEPCARAAFALQNFGVALAPWRYGTSAGVQTTDGRRMFRKLEEQSHFKAALDSSPEEARLLKQLMCSAGTCVYLSSSSSGTESEKHTLNIHMAGHSVCATHEQCLSYGQYGLDSQDM